MDVVPEPELRQWNYGSNLMAAQDVTFLVAAIDNQGDKAIYVGPMFSYCEFQQDAEKRMTDEEWEVKVNSFALPPRPSWSLSFQPQVQTPSVARKIGP